MSCSTSFDLFRREVFSLDHFNWDEIDQIAERAREGDKTAREALIQRCLPFVIRLAWRYKPYLPHDDYGDIVGIGNLALVTCLDSALAAKHPVGYLMRCAFYRIVKYVARRSSLIHQPETSTAIPVLSLEEHPVLINTLSETSSQPVVPTDDWLIRALEELTPLQKEVVLIKYGFPQRSCDSLYQLAKKQGHRGRYSSSLKVALRKLREHEPKYQFIQVEACV